MFDDQSFDANSFSTSAWNMAITALLAAFVGVSRLVAMKTDNLDSVKLPPAQKRTVKAKSASIRVGLRR